MTPQPRAERLGERALQRTRPRLVALSRLPVIRRLQTLAGQRGEAVWIVGGIVRDLILGLPADEIDVAVNGAEILADELEAAGCGRKVRLSEVEPRVFRIAGNRILDIAEIVGGSIDTDLARRDFTANAMAWEPEARLLRDPFGGLSDLCHRRLRIVAEKNLFEDPLRILRAARLFAARGLKPDAKVTATCRRAAPGLAAVAPERLRDEWSKILESPRVREALAWFRATGALAPALGVPAVRCQAPRMTTALRLLDAPWIVSTERETRKRLRLALIVWGLGFLAETAAAWLARRRFSREESRQVCRLLELAERARRAQTPDHQWEWIREAGAGRPEALALAAGLSPRSRKRIRQLARRRPRKIVRIRGEDIMAWLKIGPGPLVGDLLRAVETESLRGRLRTRGQAREWLQKSLLASLGRPKTPARSPRPGGR